MFCDLLKELDELYSKFKRVDKEYPCKKLDKNYLVDNLISMTIDNIIHYIKEYNPESSIMIKYEKYEVKLFFIEDKPDGYDIQISINYLDDTSNKINFNVTNNQNEILFEITFHLESTLTNLKYTI